MTVFGIFMMIGGIGIHFIPTNDIGVINLGFQFLGTTIGVSGSVIFVGGFLQENLIAIRNVLERSSQSSSTTQPIDRPTEKTQQALPKGAVLASKYSETKGETIEETLTKIKSGEIQGGQSGGRWYVQD